MFDIDKDYICFCGYVQRQIPIIITDEAIPFWFCEKCGAEVPMEYEGEEDAY